MIERIVALGLFVVCIGTVLRVGYIAGWMWYTGTYSYTANGWDGHMLVLIFIAGFGTLFDLGCRAVCTLITGRPLE